MKESTPPKLFHRFFRWYCHPKLLKYIEGDLMELYEERKAIIGKRKADLKFIIDVLLLFRPGIIRPTEGYQHVNNYGMLKNYFKIGWRNLIKDKVYSFINITGLSLGIAVSVLILIFVAHEYSYDRFHENGHEIFRVEKQFSRDGRHSLYANPDFATTMKELDPHIVNYVRMFDAGQKVVMSDPQHRFFEERFIFSDTSFFTIFSFKLLKGDKNSLANPNTVAITEKAAERYFGNTDVIGKSITYDKDYSFEIVALAKNPPVNSSLQFDFVASFNTLQVMPAMRNLFIDNSSAFPTYLQLAHAEDLPGVEKSILKTTYTNENITYSLSPLFQNHFDLNFGDGANTRYIFIFLCVGLLVLVLALINYMNLTTARATSRAKEVGIRKVIGAQRKTLLVQFYIESAITTLISFILAAILIRLSIPALENIIQQKIDVSFLLSPFFIGLMISLLLVCIILAGSYPAIVLPQFKPVEVLRGKLSGKGQGAWVRKTLIVFQFSVSIGLIICTLVMQRQLNYLQSKKIGIQREQVMVIPVDMLPTISYQTLKSELLTQSGVTAAGLASVPLFKASLSGVSMVTSPLTNEKVGTKWIIVDKEFLDVLGIEWQEKPESDLVSGNYLINETAAETLGDRNKIGYDFTMGSDQHAPNNKIAGIVKDFNFQTLRARIEPLVMSIAKDISLTTSEGAVYLHGALYIRLEPQTDIGTQISSIKNIFEKFSEDAPFTYYFLDDAFNDLHQGEQRLGKIFIIFTSVTLCIAFLGLFGLVTFTTERRTKEISIRQVLGASWSNILSLLSADLIVLLCISILVSVPLAWIIMQKWLNNFFYQTDVPVWSLAVSAISVTLISFIIICSQGIRAVLENPTKNLKSE